MKLENVPITGQDRFISGSMSAIGKALFVGGMGLLLFAGERAGVAPGLALLMAPICILGSYAARVMLPPMLGRIEVREGDVVVGTRLLTQKIRARRIRSAWVVTRKLKGVERPAVEIRTRGGNLHRIFVPDVQAGAALVEAMGCGVGGRAARLDLGRPLRRLVHPFLAMIATVFSFLVLMFVFIVAEFAVGGSPRDPAVGFLFVAMIMLVYELLKRAISPPVVTIGTDGIEVKRGFETRRIAREELVRAGATPGGPLVVLRRGARSVVVGGTLLDHALLATATAEIERRLGTTEPHPRAASFERGLRGVGEWKAGLRATLDAGYRAAGVTVDDASAVLESASASPEQRIGAALTLRVAGAPPERIRIAAEGTVDPELRVAFEAIADDERDERIEQTLRKLSS